MRVLLVIGLIVVGRFGHAALPTISCQSSSEKFVFEEGIDEYFIDVEQLAVPNNLAGKFIQNQNEVRQKSLVQMAIAKSVGTGPSRMPTCLFHPQEAFLISCPLRTPTVKVKVTNITPDQPAGEAREYKIGSFQFFSEESKRRKLGGFAHEPKIIFADDIEFVFDGYAFPEVAGRQPVPLSSRISFPKGLCKLGELAESPAR